MMKNITRTAFWGVFKNEFLMSISRKGLFIAYSVVFVFYYFTIFFTGQFQPTVEMNLTKLWDLSALIAFMFNLFLPVVGGIFAADRLVRDRLLHVFELLQSSSLSLPSYILGKYLGTLGAICLPVLGGIIIFRVHALFLGAPLVTVGMSLITFLTINLPAYAFITAFSIVLPLVIPLRVYQVLFTGYWFWGNFVYPDLFPSLSGTLLQVSGKVPAEGLFGSVIDMGTIRTFVIGDVWINYLLILACIFLALMGGYIFLSTLRE